MPQKFKGMRPHDKKWTPVGVGQVGDVSVLTPQFCCESLTALKN